MDSSMLRILMRITRAMWVVLAIVLTILALIYVTPIVYPFIIAWILAYMMVPLVNLLERKARFPRWLGSIVVLIAFLGLFAALITLLISRIVVEISRFAQYINNHMDQWIDSYLTFLESEWIQRLFAQVTQFSTQNERLYETIEQNVLSAGERISEGITGFITSFVDGLLKFAAGLPSFAFIIVIIFLAAFFMCKDWYRLSRRIVPLFPQGIAETTRNIWNDLKRALFGYLRAQLIMISITAVFIMIGLLVMRVNYAITIGLLLGLIDLLPYLGVGLVMVPWAVYLFVSGDVMLGIGISVLYGIITVTRSMIEPKVLASSIGLDALSTLIAMVIGLQLFGVIGVIIGPVTLVVLVALHKASVFSDIRRYIMDGPRANDR